MHIYSQNKPNKFKRVLFARQKVEVNCILGQRISSDGRIRAEVHCETLEELCTFGHSEQKAWNGEMR
jgi:hypothetical protein